MYRVEGQNMYEAIKANQMVGRRKECVSVSQLTDWLVKMARVVPC